MLKILLLPALVLSNSLTAVATEAPNSDAVQQIENVVESFRVSIINKDRKTFRSLFYSDDIPFVAVFSDQMLE